MAVLLLTDVRGGIDDNAPIAIPEQRVVDAVNVSFSRSMLGERRGGAQLLASGLAQPYAALAVRTLTDGSEQLWGLTRSDTSASYAKWTANAAVNLPTLITPTLNDGFLLQAADAVNLQGNLYMAARSQNPTTSGSITRLHVWDSGRSVLRRVGLAAPPSAPSVTNTGSGSFNVARRYRVRFMMSGPSTVRPILSEPSSETSFTPSGSGVGALITRPALLNEGEDVWIAEASVDGGANYYVVGVASVATTTITDSLTTPQLTANPLSAAIGSFVPPVSAKFVAVDRDHLLVGGNYEDSQQDSDVSWTVVSTDASLRALALSYPVEVLVDAPEVYLRLNETSGTSAADATGHGYTGTVVGAGSGWGASSPISDGGTAFFHGSTRYINLPVSGTIASLTGTATFEGWFNVAGVFGSGYWTIWSKGTSWHVDIDFTGQLVVYHNGTGTVLLSAGVLVDNGAWQHIALVRDATAGTYKTYVNGTLQTTVSYAGGAPASNANNLRIGADGGGAQLFSGWSDEIAVWVRTLSATEISEHYAARAVSIGLSTVSYSPERVPATTGNTVRLNALNDGGLTGFKAFNQSMVAFKRRSIYVLDYTGSLNALYVPSLLTKAFGALAGSVVEGADESGNPALYFVDEFFGPMALGTSGFAILAPHYQRTFVAQVNTTGAQSWPGNIQAVFYRGRHEVWWNVLMVDGSWQWLVYNTQTKGLSRHTRPSTSTTLPQSAVVYSGLPWTSQQRLPQSDGMVSRWDTSGVIDDYGNAFTARVTSRAYTAGSAVDRFSVRGVVLDANAASGVSVQCQVLRDYGRETASRIASVAPVAGEAYVSVPLDDLVLSELTTAQFAWGDAPSGVVGAWMVQRLAARISAQGPNV